MLRLSLNRRNVAEQTFLSFGSEWIPLEFVLISCSLAFLVVFGRIHFSTELRMHLNNSFFSGGDDDASDKKLCFYVCLSWWCFLPFHFRKFLCIQRLMLSFAFFSSLKSSLEFFRKFFCRCLYNICSSFDSATLLSFISPFIFLLYFPHRLWFLSARAVLLLKIPKLIWFLGKKMSRLHLLSEKWHCFMWHFFFRWKEFTLHTFFVLFWCMFWCVSREIVAKTQVTSSLPLFLLLLDVSCVVVCDHLESLWTQKGREEKAR